MVADGAAAEVGGRLRLFGGARFGNVFGGGDYSEDRLIPDAVRAYSAGRPVIVRNPVALRPWQHVVEPLTGYLMLARALFEKGHEFAMPFNFGPLPDQQVTVSGVVAKIPAEGVAAGQPANFVTGHGEDLD